MFSVHPLSPHLGSACALLDADGTALLLDAGFAYCADYARTKLHTLLEDRPLQGMLITHSHYDHIDGVPLLKAAYPDAIVYSSAYTSEVLARPRALAQMQALDEAAAADDGLPPLIPFQAPSIDRVLSDGEIFSVGSLEVEAITTPGHTRCSMSFFFPSLSLLCASETTGVYADESHMMPGMIVGYQMTLDAIDRLEALSPEHIYLPHNGLLPDKTRTRYFKEAREVAEWTADLIRTMHQAGADEGEILAAYRARVYPPGCLQPERAFLLNARAMIARLTAELCG